MRCCWATNTELPIEWCWVCFCCVSPVFMDSASVRLLGMGELYFSPGSASFLVCDPQGVTCSDAAFAHYKKVGILILTEKEQFHQWVRQINKSKDWSGVLLISICQERSIGATILLPWLDSFSMTLQLHVIICHIFSLAELFSTDIPAILHFSPILYPCSLHVSLSDLRYFKLIQSNLSCVHMNDCVGQHQDLN